MYKHMYCVPTHRLIPEDNLLGFFKEVEYVNTKYKLRCPLVVFEDSDTNPNLSSLQKFKHHFKDVPVCYITKKRN